MHSKYYVYKLKFSIPKKLSVNSNKNQTKVIRGKDTTCVEELKNTTPKHIGLK